VGSDVCGAWLATCVIDFYASVREWRVFDVAMANPGVFLYM